MHPKITPKSLKLMQEASQKQCRNKHTNGGQQNTKNNMFYAKKPNGTSWETHSGFNFLKYLWHPSSKLLPGGPQTPKIMKRF